MTQAVQVYSPPSKDEWESLNQTATVLVNSGFLPRGIKNANQAMMIFLAGREIGWSPIMALQFIDVINQKARVNARGLLALAYSKIPTFEFVIDENTHMKAVVRARRNKDAQWVTGSFTMEDAQKANLLTGASPWTQGYARDMLYHKAVARAVNAVAPDAIFGSSPLPPEEESLDEAPSTAPEPLALAPTTEAAPAAPTPAPADDKTEDQHKEEFMALAKKLNFAVNKREAVVRLLDNLGVAHGQSSKDMPPGAWKTATATLREKYKDKLEPSSAAVVEPHVHRPDGELRPDGSNRCADCGEKYAGPVGAEDAPPVEEEPVEDDPDDEDMRTDLVEQLKKMLDQAVRLFEGRQRPFVREWPAGSGKLFVTDPVLCKSAGETKKGIELERITFEQAQAMISELEVILPKAGR